MQGLPRSPATAHALACTGMSTPAPPRAAGDRRPYVDAAGAVHWPALFFYPEASMANDTLEDFCEHDTFRCGGGPQLGVGGGSAGLGAAAAANGLPGWRAGSSLLAFLGSLPWGFVGQCVVRGGRPEVAGPWQGWLVQECSRLRAAPGQGAPCAAALHSMLRTRLSGAQGAPGRYVRA